MRLIYADVDEGLLSCVNALETAGIKAQYQNGTQHPMIALQLDEKDHAGNPIILYGEFPIVYYLLHILPGRGEESVGQQELGQWAQLTLRPVVEAIKSKDQLTTDRNFQRQLAFMEAALGDNFLGGKNMSAADIIAFSSLCKLVAKNNSWFGKKFPLALKWTTAMAAVNSIYTMDVIHKFVNGKEIDGEYRNKLIASLAGSAPSRKQKGATGIFQSNARIVRKNAGTEILPRPDKKNILITSALPYVNNVPHLGNLIGSLLSADVFARYSRLRGNNTLYICGTDEYGTATEFKALQEGLTPQGICDKYSAIHRQIYEWFQLDFDYFGRTTTAKQTEIAQDIFLKLKANGELSEDDIEQPYCCACERYLADRYVEGKCPACGAEGARGDQCDACQKLLNATELIDPQCKVCGATPIIKSTKHIFLELPNIKERLDKWVNESSVKGEWSTNSIQATSAWIRDGLKKRCITRDLKWGTPVPDENFSDKVFYVWFDAPIGYISITANYTENWEQWWKNPDNVDLYQFMGKDNVPFHTVIFPCSLIGANDNYTLLHHINTTEYLNYEEGKFSKSQGVGVFGDSVQQTDIAVEVYRYFLMANRPEQSDSLFQWTDLRDKNNNELLKNLGNLYNRVLQLVVKVDRVIPEAGELQPSDLAHLSAVYDKFNEYVAEMDKVHLKNGLKLAMEMSSLGNKYLQDEKLWELLKTDIGRYNTVLNVLVNTIRLISCILEPYMPSFSAKSYEQLGLGERTERDDELIQYVAEAGDPRIITTLVQHGAKIGEVVAPMFRQISEEEINNLKEKFGGKQN